MPEPLIKNTPLIITLSIAALVIAMIVGIYLSIDLQPEVLIGF